MDIVTEASVRLVRARRSGTTAPAPGLPDTDAAYAVQAKVADALGWFDVQTPQFWKSGGAGRDAVLTHARLPAAGVYASPADLRGAAFHFRGIEAEIALRLAEPVDAAFAAAGRPPAIDAMCVSIEVVDSRWTEGTGAPAWDRLADLQSHGALVLGPWVPFEARDWSTQAVRVEIGDAVREFRGTQAFGDPAWGLPTWLCHATRDGAVLPAGTVVTTGTWCGLPLALPGDRVRVAFEGVGVAEAQF